MKKKQKKVEDKTQEQYGCCPCMFSAYQRFKKSSDVN